ncbi:hypothetical protein MLD38_008508 [Melastoma candidum]|uniref:Uncharacterized protein n=1 Tax=Melastoma candidum TaxID=119954 RepID=A0ACB9RU94_9MYRT|nr:hypothetical protein MLD38_008508 [Melastoma candidum]
MNLFCRDALKYHAKSKKLGFTPTIFTFNSLIRVYSQNGLLSYAHKLFDEIPCRNVYSWNAIISAYVKSQDFTMARALFDAASSRDLVTYNTMLAGFIGVDGYEGDALELFRDMQSADVEVGTGFDGFTFTAMLNLVAKLGVRSFGVQLHGYMVRTGNDRDVYVLSSLIDMYSKCGAFGDAYKMFLELGSDVDSASKNAMVAACCREGYLEAAVEIFEREPELNDVISWNTMISGYSQNGKEAESLDLFVKMRERGIGWNEHTFTSVLSSCAGLKNLRQGKEVHVMVLKNGLVSNPFVKSAVVDVYCKCGSMKYAEVVYAAIEGENSFATTSMIVGYSCQGDMLKARMLFDSLTEKNSITWTSLFSGYVKSQQCESVFELFNVYRGNKSLVLDVPAIISVLSACSVQAALDPGKQLHAYVVRAGIKMDEILISSFIDMYSKSGNLSYAEKMYQKLGERDTVVYNIMIAGYANHGHENRAIQTYNEMLEKGLKPDAATFIALLSACRHCGLVELGENYFLSMTEDFDIIPETDHFTCMIDLYGRANQLEKAVSFLRKIPFDLDAAMLGAFLNACKLSKNLEFARKAAEALLRIQEGNGSRYVQLANLYAAEENWAEMRRVRERMKDQEAKKFAGCSWLYAGAEVHAFSSGGLMHPKAEAINSVLATLRIHLNKEASRNTLMFG